MIGENRPAEKTTAALGVAAAIAAAFSSNWEQVVTAVVLGVIPSLVTTWVEVGGFNGLKELFWQGRRK